MSDNSAMDTLRGILGDNADEKIQKAMSMISAPTEKNEQTDNSQIMQLKGLIDQISTSRDSRSNLLLSLRPFMSGKRQQTIDSAVKLLNLTKLSGLFKQNPF